MGRETSSKRGAAAVASRAAAPEADASENGLDELYTWDTVIEDEFLREAGDPKRDEDRALEAYEDMIHMAARPDEMDNQVLSLAAQLLTKHFFRFPHVQLNVVGVLLALCGADRPLALRIHTVRALVAIVKTPVDDLAAADDTDALAWLRRIADVIDELLRTESSAVMLRQMTPLSSALHETMHELQQRQPAKEDASKTQQAQSPDEPVDGDHHDLGGVLDAPSGVRKSRDDALDRSVEYEHAAKRAKHSDDAGYPSTRTCKLCIPDCCY